MDPNQVTRLRHRQNRVGKALIDPHIGYPIALVVPHVGGKIMKQRPQRAVRHTGVVTVVLILRYGYCEVSIG